MSSILYLIYQVLSAFLQLITAAIFIYCITTWIAPRSSLRYWLERIIEPFCAPFRELSRKIMMRWGGRIDFTCWFAMIGIQILQQLLRLLYQFLVRLF